MKVPISWLKDFVDIDISIEDLARKLTLAGLEVEEIRYVGLPMPEQAAKDMHSQWKHEFKTSGIAWDRDKLVVAEIREVMPHPNADRLVLCDLYDGRDQLTVLTGAPNLFEFKGMGKLEKPIKAAYAREGATLYDGHQPGQALMTLKRTRIRGVDSFSMVCSEKELGISEEHEGIIILDDDAPVGVPLADYMGDAVLEIAILPNNARNVNILGIAREVAALTGKPLKKPVTRLQTEGEPIEGLVSIEITEPELNPRFTLGLVRDVKIGLSPYWAQRRLRLAGMRPINNVVDATNYAMIELGEPLHAFDYDVLVHRAKGKPVRIITRTAHPGEKLTTLDNVKRSLEASQVLVCDEAGALSIAGVMGGLESEVYDASAEVLDAQGIPAEAVEMARGKVGLRSQSTTSILLEAAAWNFINIRRTANAHAMHSEASYRFSRGVHPDLAEAGLKRGLELIAAWTGGKIAPGIVDNYPLPPADVSVDVTPRDVKRLLGIDLSANQIADLLERLEFTCTIQGETVAARAPRFRLDIGEGEVGLADVLEEVARMYGYDRIPETRMADSLPPQVSNLQLEGEERLRDLLATLGLQEVVSYRLTSPEREARLWPKGHVPAREYVLISNPIAPERSVLRRSLLAMVLEAVEHNARLDESLGFFEIGPVFEPRPGELPNEPHRLAFALSGRRQTTAWDVKSAQEMDFYDLRGLVEMLLASLHLDATYHPDETLPFHPGKCARVMLGERPVGIFGELHPLVQANYAFEAPVLAAEFDVDALLETRPAGFDLAPVPAFPPVLEDIAVIVDENIPADRVEALIRQTGGRMLGSVRLFDVYRGEQIGPGKKSLAYSLTYQSFDKTLTDKDAAAIRNKIVRRLEMELDAKLRG